MCAWSKAVIITALDHDYYGRYERRAGGGDAEHGLGYVRLY